MAKWKAFGGEQAGERRSNPARQRAVALDAEGFVELAGVFPPPEAGRASAAIPVRGYGDVQANMNSARRLPREFFYSGSDFVSGDTRVGDQRVAAQEGAEIGAAKSHGTNA